MSEFHWFMAGAFVGAFIQALAIGLALAIRKARKNHSETG